MKCKKCVYFYRSMAGENGIGYNPFPFCHFYEETEKTPSVLTQECYKPSPRKRPSRRSRGQKGNIE